MNKEQISKELKDIRPNDILKEWNTLREISQADLENLGGRSKLGCKLIDYFFFQQRLETTGNKGIHFFHFLENIEYYKTKKYIQTLLSFCDNTNRYKDNAIKKYYYCYGLCFGRVNAFKITNALCIYNKYKPTKVLDPFAGFGGRLIGCALNNIKYTGIDLNIDLKSSYDKLFDFLNTNSLCNLNLFEMIYENSENIDYSGMDYDMVFTSPPYYNIEIYRHTIKKTEKEWDLFYVKVFENLWKYLKNDGYFIININDKIYNKILVPLLGPCNELFPLKKSSRNSYIEYIYVWHKSESIN